MVAFIMAIFQRLDPRLRASIAFDNDGVRPARGAAIERAQIHFKLSSFVVAMEFTSRE
jgi:hypothetical protein